MTATALIAVNHLQGAGHLKRALTLAHAFSDAGHSAHILTGGFPAPQFDTTGVDLHQIPPVRSDGPNFARLLTETGSEWDTQYSQNRIAAMKAVLRRTQPDVLIIELFPLGRRILRAEYLAFLEAAASLPKRPRIVCSIRDILAPPSKPKKITFAEDTLAAFFDLVLVHSDQRVIRLEDSWPVSEKLAPYLRYTGFVAPALTPARNNLGTREIIVSTGSGDMGDRIIDAALQAARPGETWRCLVGGPDLNRISRFSNSKQGVTIERPRPDFRTLLQNATASISLCGYNTSMDLLQTGVPAVIVPYDEGAETEQSQRATALARLPGIERLQLSDITPENLRMALEKCVLSGRRDGSDMSFDGARETVRILT